jgi:hypothetical protein
MNATARRTYIVECYGAGLDRQAVAAAGGRALAAAADLRGEGWDVEYLDAILVPADEVVFHIFAAGDSAFVAAASIRAALPIERIVESVAVRPGAV